MHTFIDMTVYIISTNIYNIYKLLGSNPLRHVHGIAALLALAAMRLLAGHTSHVPEPTCVLNLSAAQAVQASGGPEKPASHAHWSLPDPAMLFDPQGTHVLLLVAASLVENMLLGQFVHATLPVTGLYVPRGHASHQSVMILVSTSVPCACTSMSATWLAIELRTYR
jgi:hypothetical protein